MLAFPGMLVGPAEKAGIPVPEDPDQYLELREEYPRFFAYCVMQLGQPLPHPAAHWENAEVIAEIPEERLETITPGELIEEFGFQIGYSHT